jgi:hypothetical protein
MSSLRFKHQFGKLCAVGAIVLALPALAYAEKGGDKDRGGDHNPGRFPVVPEANAGWVLAPFFGLVLIFSARHLFLQKRTE